MCVPIGMRACERMFDRREREREKERELFFAATAVDGLVNARLEYHAPTSWMIMLLIGLYCRRCKHVFMQIQRPG